LATDDRSDRALKIDNARILTGVYYGLLAVVFTLTLDATIYVLGFEQFIPLFEGTLLAMFIASVFGLLFGEKIVHAKYPYMKKAFYWGLVKTLCALPFYCLGFLAFYLTHNADLASSMSWGSVIMFYLKIVAESYLLIGFWLAILSGLAAVYLRSKIVYYIYDSSDD
jgi:hypothetical protein